MIEISKELIGILKAISKEFVKRVWEQLKKESS